MRLEKSASQRPEGSAKGKCLYAGGGGEKEGCSAFQDARCAAE